MQQKPVPFFRESGAGPGVVCVHANAGSSSQWRGLMDLLAPKFHVLAPDTHGAGKGPPWPTDRKLTLGDEVASMEPVFDRAGDPFVLVGHSYGGGIALVAAAKQPHRVRAMALYEPTLFALVDAVTPPPNDTAGIRDAVARSAAALDAGDGDAAARHFIDFWMNPGAWDATPDSRKGPIAASIANIRGWASALIDEPTPLEAIAALDFPVLLMAGSESPLSSRAVAKVLQQTLRHVEVQDFAGLGHMGPLTHPERVNSAIAAFLDRI